MPGHAAWQGRLQLAIVFVGSSRVRRLLPAREPHSAQNAVPQHGHAAACDVQGAAPMKRRPVMGPALLPAGTTLSMFRWSLSFTAAQKGRGVSPVCRSHFRISTKAAPWSITNNQGVVRQQARGCWSTEGCGAGKLERLLAGHTSNAPQGGLWLLTNDFVRLSAGLYLHMVTTSRTCMQAPSAALGLTQVACQQQHSPIPQPHSHTAAGPPLRDVHCQAGRLCSISRLGAEQPHSANPGGFSPARACGTEVEELHAGRGWGAVLHAQHCQHVVRLHRGRHKWQTRRVAHTTDKVVRRSSSCTPQGAAQAAAGAGRSKSNPACQKPGRQKGRRGRGTGWSDMGSFWKAIHAWNS